MSTALSAKTFVPTKATAAAIAPAHNTRLFTNPTINPRLVTFSMTPSGILLLNSPAFYF
jgi:hypothetical protein